MQYRPGYPQTSTAIQEEIWIDVSKRVDYQSLQWEQQATEQNTALRFDIFTMLNLSTTRYDDYASWGTSGNGLDAYTQTSLGMVDAINDPSFFIDIANRTEVKVQEWALVSGHYEVVRTLWGGVVSSVDTERQGDAFVVQRVECADYTALLDELIIRDYNAPTVSAALGERPTISGLTTEVIAGGLTLTAGPYTFRVVAYNAANEIVEIFTHVSQNLTATDIDPPGISDPELRTIRLNWSTVAGATYYKVFAKSGIGVKDMYYKATVTSPTATYSLSTAPAVAGELSPEDKVQKGSIDVDIISGSSDPANANYKGIFNGLDPDLDPGIDNQTSYVETAKKLNDGTPDPEKSYRFSPTLETGVVLTSPFGGKTLKQALNIIIEKTGGVFWVDANKDLHYTNKQARELVENPRFESSPASSGYSLAGGHSILQDRGPYGYGRALVASSGATTAESQTSAIPVTANQYYFARVKGWAKTNFSLDWDAELRFYSNVGGTTQVGSSYKLERNISFDSTDDGRWCKAWAMARAGATAVTARIVFMKKRNGGDEVAWTDFSVVKVTGSMGFSDSPSETAYALPMKSFETPKAPRSASKVANRLLVYGVYKDANNPSELESVETDISLTLRKVAAGTLAAGKYYVRVVATVGTTEIICKYATETITDQDVIDGNRELYASWAAVTGASSYKIYVGTKRFAMRLKATQAGTTLSIQSPAAGGAAISTEPSVYYYKVFDFAPGIWEAGGKIIEAAINDSLVDNDDKASTRALSFWEEKGIAERTWEFDTFETEVPMVGEVIPFVWIADDTAEPLMVKGIKAKLLGDRVYYTVTVGDDPLLTKRGVTQIFADMQAATARLNDTIAPEAPQSLSVTAPVGALLQTPDGVTRATVTAQWTPSPEDDFAHYSVEYGYDENFTEVQRANVSQTSDSQSASTGIKANVVHTFQAEPGKKLYYRVAAIDNTNNKSPWSSDEIDLPQDITPCDPPYNALVSPGLKSNTVTWQFDFYNPESPLINRGNSDFARFRVYRRVHNTGAYAVIAETSATQYVDTDFANYSAGYNYAVTSLDRTGNQSGVPGNGGATGVAYNTASNVPSKIDGGVDITTASISGAQIASATITDANVGSLSATKITAGTLSISTGMTIATNGTAALPQFEVDKDGLTVRNNSGNVVLQVNGATSTLNANYINVTNLAASEVTVGTGNSVVRVGNYPNSTSPTFQGIWGGNANPSSAAFTLNTSGILTATSASISGSVSASSGAIGGWAIDSDKIYKATAVSPYITGIYTGTSASSGLTFFAGAATSTGTSAAFSVTNAGAVTATNANISGTISASAGQIGGFTIASDRITNLGTTKYAGIIDTAADSGLAFFAGATSTAGTGAVFSVTNAGALAATSASITGSVTANSGAIGGWIVEADKIYNSSSNSRYVGLKSTSSSTGLAIFAGADSSGGANSAFSVTNSGAVVATNISVLGGDVVIGKQGPSIASLAKDSVGIVTVITSTAHEYTAGSKILIDVESGTYQNDVWANGYKTVLPDGITSTQLKYDSGTSGAITTVSVIGHLYNGSQMAVGGDGGIAAAWMTINNKLSIKSPTTGADIIAVGADGVTINANFLNAGSIALGGLDNGSNYAITSTNFNVTKTGALTAASADITGSVTATSGSIGGWSVDSSRIYNALASSPYIAGVQGSSTSTGVAFFAGGTSSTGATAAFKVTNDGALTATSASITGVVTATSGSFTGTISASAGQIGGWTISSDRITNLGATKYAGIIDTATDNGLAFFAGATSTAGTGAVFSVTNEGALTATSASVTGTISTSNITATGGFIGGWSLSSTSLTGGNTTIASAGDITLGTGENVARLSSSNAAYRLWLGGSTASTAPFRVTSTGEMTATSASITGTVSTNNITATGGFIGGWSLTSTSLTNYGGSTGQYAGILDTDATGLAFFAGATTSTGTGAQFSVTNAGALTATGATISGAVTATSGSFNGSITANAGSIGGWSLTSTSLTSSNTTISSTGDITLGTGSNVARLSSSDAVYRLWLGATTGSAAPFSVTSTGSISASAGIIGGFTLSSTSLTAGTGSTAVGLLPGSYPFFAGSSTGSTAPFRVGNAGDLTATNVTIVGTDSTAVTTTPSGTMTTGKLTLQPSTSQAASLIFTDGTLVKTGTFSATRNSTTGNVVVTYTASSDILLGMFVTTASATATLVATNAKIIAVTPGASFTYQMPTGTSVTGNLTGFTLYKSLIMLGGGITRFQQTTTDAGAVATGSLILGNNDGLNNTGTAQYAIPADGELVFNSTATPKYTGGGNLYQSSQNVLRTSGAFSIGTTLAVGSTVTLSGDVDITSTTDASSTVGSGALYVAGGMYVAKKTYQIGNFYANYVDVGTSTNDDSVLMTIPWSSGSTNTYPLRSVQSAGVVTTSEGGSTGSPYGNALTARSVYKFVSQRAYKEEIQNLLDTEDILEAQPVSYYSKGSRETFGDKAQIEYGFIVEDFAPLNSITDKYTVRDADGTPMTVQYDLLTVPIISAMRSLRSRIVALEAKIARLENA